ncbi:MAG: hypothetical protein HYZ72_08510, partial [Deltaproteobacteria bacterium]|nr:hypothetical protein [Deltaproteobacteria bacterium]
VARGALLTQIAQRFAVNEEELRRMAASPDPPRSQAQSRPEPREPQSMQAMAETTLLELMLIDRQAAARIAEEGIVPAFQKWRDLATEILAAWQQSKQIDLSAFLDRLPKALADRVTRAYARPEPEDDGQERQQLLRDCLAKIRSAQRRAEREQLRREIREAEQQGNDAELRLRLQRLQGRDRQE